MGQEPTDHSLQGAWQLTIKMGKLTAVDMQNSSGTHEVGDEDKQ